MTAGAAQTNSSVDVRKLLAHNRPFVLIAVPPEFLHAEAIQGDEVETWSDWATYLQPWLENTTIIVLPYDQFRRLLVRPALNDECTTVFIRNRLSAVYNSQCVEVPYKEGIAWMRGHRLPPSAQKNLRPTSVSLRTPTH